MIIEVLYPEEANLFGDSGNVLYLQKCLPQANFVFDHYNDTPFFVSETPDLIYMGPMPEDTLARVIAKLSPYRARLAELMAADVHFLFTGNAPEVFFTTITHWNNETTEGLGLIPFTAKRSRYDHFNGLTLGRFQDKIDVVGFMSQFDFWYGDNSASPFLKVERGTGINRESALEGYVDHQAIFTALLGPILVNNPQLVRCLLDSLGASDTPVYLEKEMTDAYNKRIAEFRDPKVAVIVH